MELIHPIPGAAGAAGPDVLHEAAETFSMLASPTRRHLLWLLSHHEYDVGSLVDDVQLSLALAGSDNQGSHHCGRW